eukprot:1144649-Pelagomonas_calceolata.AAC.3
MSVMPSVTPGVWHGKGASQGFHGVERTALRVNSGQVRIINLGTQSAEAASLQGPSRWHYDTPALLKDGA